MKLTSEYLWGAEEDERKLFTVKHMNFRFQQMKIHSSTSGSGGFDQELSYMFRLPELRCSQGLQERVFAEYI